jgi:hypothetical protein
MRNPMPPPIPKPLALTDSEYTAVMHAAAPLPVQARDAFLEALAAELRNVGEIGDGRIYRLIALVQKRFWDPPIEVGNGSKYAR